MSDTAKRIAMNLRAAVAMALALLVSAASAADTGSVPPARLRDTNECIWTILGMTRLDEAGIERLAEQYQVKLGKRPKKERPKAPDDGCKPADKAQ